MSELETMIEMGLKAGHASPEVCRRVRAALQGDGTTREKLVTTRTAAEVLQCHPKTVLLYGRTGRLHPVRRSSRFLRWRVSELEKFSLTGTA